MKIIVAAIAVLLSGCNAANVPDLKANAPAAIEANGFQVVGYQGYQYGIFGGYVWYTAKRDGIVYEMAVMKWSGEYHLYNIKALNAVQTSGKP